MYIESGNIDNILNIAEMLFGALGYLRLSRRMLLSDRRTGKTNYIYNICMYIECGNIDNISNIAEILFGALGYLRLSRRMLLPHRRTCQTNHT